LIKFIICHEVLHMALLHFLRLSDTSKAEHDRVNIAEDYEVNDILVSDGFASEDLVKTKGHGLIDSKYHGMSAEEILQLLPPGQKQPPCPGKCTLPTIEAKVGSYIKTKTGEFGQITKLNADGTFEYDVKTEAEVTAALKK